MPTIPYDMYESEQEIIFIIPFGGVKKESIQIHIQHEILTIRGEREKPNLRKDFLVTQQQCFWGEVKLQIDLPPNSEYKSMTSSLSKENILSLIIPKNTIPEQIPVHIEE